jgi:beta-N-acetylhexosaminidase
MPLTATRTPLAMLTALPILLLAACADGGADPGGSTGPAVERTGATAASDQVATTQDSPATTTAAAPVPAPAEPDATATTGEPAPEAAAGPACLRTAAALDDVDKVGQLFMLSKDARTPVDAAYRDLLEQTRPGSILLLGESHAGVEATARLTDAVRDAAPTPEDVGLLVAADQEGGQVQRLRGPGFERIPSAVEQARMDEADLREAATRWGEQLGAAGVDIALAPVADVVPPEWAGVNEPAALLARHYGEDAEEVRPRLAAFVEGMDEAGIATSLKHFPGLGRVVGNTDFSGGVVDRETGPDHPDLQAFRGEAGEVADMVMISTAVYELIDPGVPAAFSGVVIDDLLRERLGFEGVVIADDLGAAAQVADVPPGERAVRFLAAGGDIVINANPSVHRLMVDAVHAELADDPGFAQEVDAKVARVLTMKERRGAARCG